MNLVPPWLELRMLTEWHRLRRTADSRGLGRLDRGSAAFQSKYATAVRSLLGTYHRLQIQGVPDERFDQAWQRLTETCGGTDAIRLAAFLDCAPEDVAEAIRLRRIPASWLLYLAYMEGIAPAWILTGRGERHLHRRGVPGWKDRPAVRRIRALWNNLRDRLE